MTQKTCKPFGTWKSHISPADVAESAPKLNEPSLHDGWLYWLQSIPEEQGRMGLFCRESNLTKDEAQSCPARTSLISKPFNIRSMVHEYGGKSYCIAKQTLYFVNAKDQQIYSAKINYPAKDQGNENKKESHVKENQAKENSRITSEAINVGNAYKQALPTLSEPKVLTHTPDTRYGELSFDRQRQLLICIGETHDLVSSDCFEPQNGHEPINFIAGIHIDKNNTLNPTLILAQGQDFYAYPKVSPNGKYLSYIAWDHPNLPWDTTSLHILDMTDFDKKLTSVTTNNNVENIKVNSQELAVGTGSILQPSWSNNNELFYISDCDNWWNIYSIEPTRSTQTQGILAPIKITDLNVEFATPLWNLGMSTYAFLDDQTLAATYTKDGLWFLCLIDIKTKKIHTLESRETAFRDFFSDYLSSNASNALSENIQLCFINASSVQNEQVNCISSKQLFSAKAKKIHLDSLLTSDSSSKTLSINDISIGEKFTFESGNREAHAFFYPPNNACYAEQKNEKKPPVIVLSHGGPTGQATNTLNLKIQFWTNRGFSVIDVNYTGSTGYGRDYRHALYGYWGVYDVEDLVSAVEYAATKNWINKNQKIIKGSSAGGYSVLASLAFTKTFNAGVCLYGIGDLELLAKDTHKFEARYLDQLIGPYPQQKELYKQRSPIYSAETLNCPLLIFQGLEDKVVPPNQATSMANALRSKKLPVALVEYPDEGHGFRNPKNIQHMMVSELFFYQKIFSLNSEQDEVNRSSPNPPITIENI